VAIANFDYPMTEPLVSIIIDNYNYGQYVAGAVHSALRQTYSSIEVIVVDDGSTDNSRDVLRQFEGVATLLYQENGGQAAAFNAGFEKSSGAVVLFLDSDDELLPDAVEQVVGNWNDRYSKLHFPLEVIDVNGRPTGLTMPRVPISAGNFIATFLKTGRYVASPTSGNAFNRAFLQQVMPIPAPEWAKTADGYLNNCAPFYGEIGAIRKHLGRYRVHGQSMSSVIDQHGNLNLKVAEQLMKNGIQEKQLIEAIARKKQLITARDIVVSHWMFLKLKLALVKTSPSNKSSPWQALRTAAQMVLSAATSSDITVWRKFQYAAWASAVALLPGRSSQRIVRFGFETAPRTGVLRTIRR
jgi:glycosyltransferase involved in cell wall biosynthesis